MITINIKKKQIVNPLNYLVIRLLKTHIKNEWLHIYYNNFQRLKQVKNSIFSIYIIFNLPAPKNVNTDYNDNKNGSYIILLEPTITVVKSST